MRVGGYVYMMTNKNKTVLYVGVTNNLVRRVEEHKTHFVKGSFTDRYNCEYCIYFEEFSNIIAAIQREKVIKKMSRQNKEKLINALNPEWKEMIMFSSAAGTVRETEKHIGISSAASAASK